MALLPARLVLGLALLAPATARPGRPPTQVMVRAGDTLWDLAATYLGSPWAWRTLWRLNPEIVDPKQLAVGATLRLSTAADPRPAVASALTPGDAASSLPAPAPPLSAPAAPAPAGAAARPSPRAAWGPEGLRLGALVWPRGKGAGLATLTKSFGDSQLGRPGERWLAQAGREVVPTADANYVILAAGGTIRGLGAAPAGELWSVAGVARGLVTGTRAEVQVVHMFAEIAPKQRLAPLAWFLPDAAPGEQASAGPAAPADLWGQVLAVQENALVVGGGKLAFINVGTAAGLAPGMRLWLHEDRPTGQAAAEGRRLPVGELEVLDVQPHHGTCRVVSSAHEIGRGQWLRGAK